ncbi:rubisco accumulation factor 1.1, chloroplastic-like [Humulus lupulus]|uniref:rubisco accumulation factor 1.1, chloroplastic-like n=1 Tax=Humulus lupulus TaxID=3486 RepID=UPI002B40CCD7|nr:rubisco accumulation factor 1.1, chloroplastic-like [Humulus lupulus]
MAMAMLSFTANTLKPLSPFYHDKVFSSSSTTLLSKPSLKPISATLIPSSNSHQQQQLYQPFRPPPSPLPNQFRSLDTAGRLDVLTNRLGRWFEYAPIIPSLVQEGFTPSSIEEATGISGVEQNRLLVAAQVRESLLQSKTDPEIVAHFDSGGSELLYEIRLLSAQQRSAAAAYIVGNGFDGKGVQDLARAIKDFPRRRGDKGWESFNYTHPGDCLSFMYYRQGREHKNPSDQRTNALEQALNFAETEGAKARVLEELHSEGNQDGAKGEIEDTVLVPVVRLKIGEVAEASSVAVLPVCRAEEREKEVLEAPGECRTEGEFNVVVAEKGWKSWVVLPAWEPVVGLGKGGIVIAFSDARVLPWKTNKWYKEESILVVADRKRKEVAADDGVYLVAADGEGGLGEGLKVMRGLALKNLGVKECLATVVMVVRPPRDEMDDQLNDEDWE